MKYSEYNRLSFTTFFLFVIILSACNDKYDKQFYGEYENNDTNRIVFSSIIFYEKNNYSYYSSTCFGHVQDTGHFVLADNAITFHSFNSLSNEKNSDTGKSLNKINFLYQSGSILHVRKISPFNKPSYFDTVLIGKKKT